MNPNIESKTGSADVKKVGHTYSNAFGLEPNAKVKGRPVEPTPQTFGK